MGRCSVYRLRRYKRGSACPGARVPSSRPRGHPSPPGVQLLPGKPAPPVCLSRARRRRPCTGQRAHGVGHRPACPLARVDRRLSQKGAGPATLLAWVPSHSSWREGRGLLRERHDQEAFSRTPGAILVFPVYPILLAGALQLCVHDCRK